MVVDPFSIAGAVGLAAGLTGFVASTVEKAVGQITTATHAPERLNGHQLALQTCQERLEAWVLQWHGSDELARERLNDRELRFLWGHNGFEQVEMIKTAILVEQEDLCKLLYGHGWAQRAAPGDQRRWTEYIDGAKSFLAGNVSLWPDGQTGLSESFLTRVKTALWSENLLTASVGRLEKRVDNLERTACMRFHKAHEGRGTHYTQPSQGEIAAVIRQQRRMQHLFHDLLDAYDHLQTHRSDLSFTPFDDTEICQLETQHELTVTFLTVGQLPFDIYIC